MKTCFKCGVQKSVDSFYAHPMMADGHLGKCKDCAKADVTANRAKRTQYYREYDKIRFQRPERKRQILDSLARQNKAHPEKNKARHAVSNAIRAGKLTRKPCEVCGDEKSQAHHTDYSKPFDVQWLCFRHHRAEHGQVI